MDHQRRYDLFTVTQAGGRCEIRPSSPWGSSGAVISAAGGVFCFYIAGIFIARGDSHIATLGLAALFLAPAAMVLRQALNYWRLRRTPLVVDGNGRVTYGAQELCPPAAVTTVQIVPDPGAEHRDDCLVMIEMTDERSIPLPLPYFGAIGRRELARSLAEVLAEALRTNVVEVPAPRH